MIPADAGAHHHPVVSRLELGETFGRQGLPQLHLHPTGSQSLGLLLQLGAAATLKNQHPPAVRLQETGGTGAGASQTDHHLQGV